MNQGKAKIGLTIAICFLLGVGGRSLRSEDDDGGGSTPTTSVTNIIAAHKRSSPQYNSNCTGCHTTVLTEQSLNPYIHTVHVTMQPNVPGRDDNRRCAFCHRSVDLLLGSAGNIRRQVDVTLCALCHGPLRPAPQFYQTGPSPTQPDGPSLYALACSGCHGDLANSEVRGESASEIQGEINDNEGGMRPLQILTTLEIQAIATALAN